MVRSERLAATPDRDGMLDLSRDITCRVTAQDVTGFTGIDQVAIALGKMPSMVEYWKSAPYLFNFMDEYKVKKDLNRAWASREPGVRSRMHGAHVLAWPAIEQYNKLDSRNPRARWLIEDLAASGAFDRLWVPPAHPQTRLDGAYAHAADFTKRLIFSGWTVAPKAVAGLVSYEYERRHRRGTDTYRARSAAARLTLPPLKGDATERFTTLALLLPCRTMAEIGDPLRRASDHGWSLPLSMPALRGDVEHRIRAEIAPLVDQAATEGRSRNIWYAGALAYLDPAVLELDPSSWNQKPSDGLRDHLAALRASMSDVSSWGPPPVDLVDRLVDLSIAGPAICSVRSLMRLAERIGVDDVVELLNASARLAWAFGSFFNSPGTDALISSAHDGAYWLQVLTHCASGGLSSVMDEWIHVLWDQQRLSPEHPDRLGEVASSAATVLSLKDGLVRADFFDRSTDDEAPHSQMLRTHFAMRFGQARGETAEGDNPIAVRNAFNSPFRPFVLISTSVGQEGLDFHHYAHAVVHWNLPGNPVDLEQREGRVHRYKNHAVRKNLAREHGRDPRALGTGDPWVAMFDAAQESDGGIKPWWIYPGQSSIQRLVPLLPMSRDESRMRDLVKATTLYRMAIGQPRQAELMEVLAALPAAEQQAVRDAMTIDLSPAAPRRGPRPMHTNHS